MYPIVQRLFIFGSFYSGCQYYNSQNFLFIFFCSAIVFLPVRALSLNQINNLNTGNSKIIERKSSEKLNEKTEETFEEFLIRNNKELSEWFDSQAEAIDLFLVGQKLTTKKNETTFRIENSSYIKERETFNNTTGFRIVLRLPNLEKYWQLQLTSYDEVEDKRGAKNKYVKQAPKDQNYGATIGWFQNLGKIRTSFQPRIELQDPLKVSHSFTFESLINVNTFHVNPKLELFAHPDKGVGIFNAYNFDFPLNRFFSLTWINEGEYQEKNHVLGVTHGLSLGQHLNSKKSISYNVFCDYNNRPDYHLLGYNLSVSWSEIIYRKILDYRLTPYLEFIGEKGFVGVPGLNINFYLTF